MYTFFTRKRVFQRAELSENGGFRMIVQLKGLHSIPTYIYLIQVHIDYPSGPVRKVIKHDLDATIVRQVAHKEYRAVANSIWRHSFLKDEILQKVYMDINKESSSLCSDKKPSILKQTKANDLIKFSEKKCEEELAERAPTLYGCLGSCVASLKNPQKNQR